MTGSTYQPLITYPADVTTQIGKGFLALCPTFEQEDWDREQRKAHNIPGPYRTQVFVTIHRHQPKDSLYVDLELIKDIWSAAKQFHIQTRFSTNFNGLSSLTYQVDACVLRHQSDFHEEEKTGINWGHHVSFLRWLIDRHAVAVCFNEDPVIYELDHNLIITGSYEAET